MIKNKVYSIIHCHTMYSNGITNIDSVTKYDEYIDFISENPDMGIRNICFTEHGSTFEWYKKKTHCEEMGMKYVHAIEAYVTESIENKVRDNYHICLYATDFEGFQELNSLISKSFNREDGHFYYTPRILFKDLINTSDKILISTACLGGILNKGKDKSIHQEFIQFLMRNKHRCYLEIQHHLVEDQIQYNKYLYKLHQQTGIPLIVGTDTHALNKKHLKGRSILQKSKSVFFDEEGWDLELKSYDELVKLFKEQYIFPVEIIEEALENTNRLVDRVQPFEIDTSYKYPKLYDDAESVLMKKIKEGVIKRGVNKYPNYKTEYIPRIKHELETFRYNKSFDFLLLDEDYKSWARENDMYCGFSRGSVSGSEVAYLIGMTDVDSIKHNLNFERFMNTERVSLADVDTDWQPNHRDAVKDYLYRKEGLYCADIITFNTVALKGSIRDVGRALEMPLDLISDISDRVENEENSLRQEYPELFEYVDIINGTIVSIGTHPCGQIVSPIPLDDAMGLCTISTCSHPVSMISMKSIDAQNYVKLDILGLDNIQLINDTCKFAGLERLIPENTPDEEEVWKSMAEDNTLIFQWESDSAKDFLRRLLSYDTIEKIKVVNPNFKYKDLVSMGNGAIRPAGASYRDALANGDFRDNGHFALNNLLNPTNGYLVYQEQIIEFLNQFCGYTMGQADIVRRGFAKKTGTEKFIPKIKDGFKKTMLEKYDVSFEESEELIINFLKIIEDASDYLFSLNHAEPYTYIGYIGGWLRYHYPLEFLTVGLNINQGNDKTSKIIAYANKMNINIKPPKFRYSKAEYMFDKDSNTIYKGIASIKYLNETVSNELYECRHKEYSSFIDLIHSLKKETSIDFRQLKILTTLNYFSEFGKNQKLLNLIEVYEKKLKNKLLKEATVEKRLIEIKQYELDLPNKSLNIKEQIKGEKEYLGYECTTSEKLPDIVYIVTEIDTKYTPKVRLYNLHSGEVEIIKCKKTDLKVNPFGEFSVIKKTGIKRQPKRKLINGTWTPTGEEEIYLSKWEIIM